MKYLAEPPDGGWGWVIVLAGMYCLAMWGSIMRCYPTFYYPLMTEYDADYASVAWLNGLFQVSYGVFTTIGPFAMRWADPRILSCILSVVCGMSCFVASFAEQLWTVQIFMGLIVGCCMGIIQIILFTYVTRYFKKRLHTANQLLCLGVSVGPLLICPVYQYLIDVYGWRGAIRMIAGFLLNLTVACALLRPINLLSDLEFTRHEEKKIPKHDVEPAAENPLVSSMRSLDMGIAGSQSLGIYTPTIRRKANEFARNGESVNDRDEQLQQKGGKLKRFCVTHHLNLFIDKIFYLYTFSWLLFAAAFFSATAFIIPYGKQELHLSDFASTTLVSAVAGGSLLARIIYALFFDRMPMKYRIKYISVLYATFSIAVLMLSFTHNQIGATVCCAVIGLLGGGTDGIYSALIAEVYNVQKYAYVYGYSNILTHSAGTAITILIGMAVDRFQSLRIAMYVGFGVAVLSSIIVFLMHLAVSRKRRLRAEL